MKEKNLIILVVIFIALMIGVFIKKNIQTPAGAPEESVAVIPVAVSEGNTDGILIHIAEKSVAQGMGEQTVRLIKENGKWVVASQYGVDANEGAVKELFNQIANLKGELRSDKPDLLADYGISDDEGVHIELTQSQGEPLRIVVGSEKIGYQNNFVRAGGSSSVYVVNGNLLAAVGALDEEVGLRLDVGKWTDKRVLHVNADDVTAISIKERTTDGVEKTVVDIRREAVEDRSQWSSAIPYAFGLSASKIKNMIDTFNNTYAREVIAPDVKDAFEAPGWQMTYTLEAGDPVALVRGRKDTEGNNYYVKVEGAGYYFLVPVSTFESREKQQGNIFSGNSLKADENSVDAIEVLDLEGKKTFSVVKKAQELETPAQEAGSAEPEKKNVWLTAKGEPMELGKVQEVLAKLRDLNVEADLAPLASLANMLEITITSEGVARAYTMTKDVTLGNGKECHFLKVKGGEGPSYCVSKPQVASLLSVIP